MTDKITLLDKVPIFTGKMHIVRNFCGNYLWVIIKGTRVAPVLYTADEEAAMSAFERVSRLLDREA
jgi:hypothetical protein